MTMRKGSICTTSVGTLTPPTCSAVVSERLAPKRKAPINTQIGRPRASMARTMAIKPAPPVMKGTKIPAPTIAM